jgi:hypothetical protein
MPTSDRLDAVRIESAATRRRLVVDLAQGRDPRVPLKERREELSSTPVIRDGHYTSTFAVTLPGVDLYDLRPDARPGPA